MRPIPPQSIAIIKQFEGFSPTPIPDLDKKQIGYGHDIQPGESLTSLTEQEATDLLAKDLADRASSIERHIRPALNDNQFSALLSLVYNVGTGPLIGHLGQYINLYRWEQAADEFPRWSFADHRQLDGLVKRREAEKQLFLTPV